MNVSILAKIKSIEDEMARTQKNKATERSFGVLKARLSKLRSKMIENQTKASGGGEGRGFDVRRSSSAIARLCMIGFPSVGKSTLLNALTNKQSEIGAYEFTTLTCIPGIVEYQGAKIQLLDLPGIIEGAADVGGRQRHVLSVARTCDMILITLDAAKQAKQKPLILKELEKAGIRVNRQRPNLSFRKAATGGVRFTSTCKQPYLDQKIIKSICTEFKIHHCELIAKEPLTVEDVIDVLENNRVYAKAVYIYNRIDLVSIQYCDKLARLPRAAICSSQTGIGLDRLLAKIWKELNYIQVYAKPRGNKPDLSEAFLLPSGSTVEDVCHKIHQDIVRDFKYALVWGRSVKHNPTSVLLKHVLHDQDVVQVMTQ